MGQLFERVTDFDNLRQSAWEVFRGKRAKVAANALFYDLEPRLLQLQRELRAGTYHHGPYRTFDIVDPKPRTIAAATLRDRVVHHALVRVLEPRFERRFIHHSYACRTGKGQHRALHRFVRWARGHRYTMVLDVRRFFPSIDHAVMREVLFRIVRDPAARDLIAHIIDAGPSEGGRAVVATPPNAMRPSGSAARLAPAYFAGDDLFGPLTRRRGLPIGNLTSQFFANVLLDQVDHHVKDRLRVKAYLRYADDLAFFGDEKAALWAVRDQVEAKLHALRLRLNRGKSRVRRVSEGVTFLGFVVRPDSVRLGPIAVRRARRRQTALQRAYAAGLPWDDVKASLQAWAAHAAHGDTHRLREAAFASRAYSRTAGSEPTALAQGPRSARGHPPGGVVDATRPRPSGVPPATPSSIGVVSVDPRLEPRHVCEVLGASGGPLVR